MKTKKICILYVSASDMSVYIFPHVFPFKNRCWYSGERTFQSLGYRYTLYRNTSTGKTHTGLSYTTCTWRTKRKLENEGKKRQEQRWAISSALQLSVWIRSSRHAYPRAWWTGANTETDWNSTTTFFEAFWWVRSYLHQRSSSELRRESWRDRQYVSDTEKSMRHFSQFFVYPKMWENVMQNEIVITSIFQKCIRCLKYSRDTFDFKKELPFSTA